MPERVEVLASAVETLAQVVIRLAVKAQDQTALRMAEDAKKTAQAIREGYGSP